MPVRCKSICVHPGCNTLTRSGRCNKHKARPDDRLSAKARGYGHSWTRLRNVYIRNNPVCELKVKCTGAAAVEVDHKLSIANGGERLDESNLQSVCKRCHAWKTATVDQQQG